MKRKLIERSREIRVKIYKYMIICIKNKIKRWKFPASKGGRYAQVKYPFYFNYK